MSWLFLFKCLLFTLFVRCSKQVHYVSRYSHFPVYFQIMVVFFFFSFLLQMSAISYQAVCYCCDFYCLIFTVFTKGTVLKFTKLSSSAIWLWVSECASFNLKENMFGIKTDSHKNKLHAGDQVCARAHTYTHTRARAHARTHARTHAR